ncbi:hypothetical protein B0H16DRAFT_1745129 [Mycena metata]|uniref:Uncharacterized protein n=1 Tax=Mycena metata TaxID=1033252 RepID=A0AAD7MDP0_9AGAR|nr:hypothetical protein B0H16DRAFT_1745129 [Mycena metata]
MTTAWILSADGGTHRSTAFRASPLLRRVAIEQYEEVFHDMLPWSRLTVLVIQGIQIKQCMAILALAPLLGSSPHEIRLGFPELPLHLYFAAFPFIVFSSTRRQPLRIRFLDPQRTHLVSLEAANIDGGGDWEETPSSEDKKSPSSTLVETLTRKKNTLTTVQNNQAIERVDFLASLF